MYLNTSCPTYRDDCHVLNGSIHSRQENEIQSGFYFQRPASVVVGVSVVDKRAASEERIEEILYVEYLKKGDGCSATGGEDRVHSEDARRLT
jgi:hypothetical protein